MELICTNRKSGLLEDEYHCEFTEECDKHRLLKGDIFKTYLYDIPFYVYTEGFDYIDHLTEEHVVRDTLCIPFRIPGATRGHLRIDKDHKIVEIKFYDETCFGTGALEPVYKRSVIKSTEKFIGATIVIENDENK